MERQLKVTGNGKMAFTPDLTVVTFRITNVSKTYEGALKSSVDDLSELKDSIVQAGFERDSIKTVDFRINEEEMSYKDEQGILRYKHIGFRYCNSMKIEFDVDNKRLGKLLYVLSKGKIYSDIRLNYSLKNKEEAKNLLLAEAVKNAKDRANILAQASDVILGEIIHIDYSWGSIQFETRDYRLMEAEVCGSVDGGYDLDITPEDIHSEDSVTIVWNIQ